jgi:hypothetical protein
MRTLLAGVATATLLLVIGVIGPPQPSGANFTAKKTNATNSVAADTPFNYLHLYSQSTDPGGTTNYAVKQLAVPAELAATGQDDTLSVELGNRRNGGNVNRVFVIQTPTAFPAGVSQITVALNVVSTPWNFSDDIATMATIAGGGGNGNNGGASTLTLGPNQRRQVNIAVPQLLGLGVLYQAEIDLKITYTGYTGNFLTFAIPLTMYDGKTGGGP